MPRSFVSLLIILSAFVISISSISAQPPEYDAPEYLAKEYLSEKMNSLTTSNVDGLDKYFSKQEAAEKYLFFIKRHLLEEYIIAYSANNYSIKKVFQNVKLLSAATGQNSSTITALSTADIHWNTVNSIGEPILGMISERHELQLIKENNTWKIISDKFETEHGNSEQCRFEASSKLRSTVEELKKTAEESLNRSNKNPPSKLQLMPRSFRQENNARSQYDRESACNWAHRYWKNYSAEFVNLGKHEWDGGDCTNFVSQCIKAGRADNDTKGNYKWYYYKKGTSAAKADSYSWTWATARGINSVLLGNFKNKEFGPKGEEKVISGDSAYTSDIGQFITFGDIINYEFNHGLGIKHSAIIVGIVHNSALDRYEPVIATHSFDSWNLPWTKNAYKTHFVHITDVN